MEWPEGWRFVPIEEYMREQKERTMQEKKKEEEQIVKDWLKLQREPIFTKFDIGFLKTLRIKP